jgi:hypothetical protein
MSETMGVPENPQAFPNAWEETNAHGVTFPYVERGMTLRDYFAGQALATMIHMSTNGDGGWNEDAVAAGAYRVADALLAARSTK